MRRSNNRMILVCCTRPQLARGRRYYCNRGNILQTVAIPMIPEFLDAMARSDMPRCPPWSAIASMQT